MSVRLSFKYEMLGKQRKQQMHKLNDLINRKNNIDSLHSLDEVNEEENKSEEDFLMNATNKINQSIMRKLNTPLPSPDVDKNNPESSGNNTHR